MGVFDSYDDWVKSQQPQRAGSAFANYPAQPPQAPTATSAPVSPSSASPAPDLTSGPVWNKPANVDWRTFLMARMAAPFQGANQAAEDYTRVAADAGSFGTADRLSSAISGSDLAQERAKTAAAYSRLGPMAPIVSGAMYAMGPGELGAAKKIGGAVAPYLAKLPLTGSGEWLGGVLGSAAEGAAAGGAGAAGHDENIGAGALTGGVLGAAGGAAGGVVGRGGELPQAPPIADLQAAKTSLSDNLKTYPINRPSVHNAVQGAIGDIRANDPAGIVLGNMPPPGMRPSSLAMPVQAPDTRNALLKLQNWAAGPGPASAHDLSGFIRQFDQIGGDAVAADKTAEGQAAHTVADQLRATVSGPAQDAMDLADQANAAYKDAKRFSGWERTSSIGADNPDYLKVASAAKQWLGSDEGQRFAPPGSPSYQALNELAEKASDPLTPTGGMSFWDLKHHLLWPAIGAGATGALASYEGTGHPWWAVPAEAAAGLAAGLGTKRALNWRGGVAAQRAADAARVSLATGAYTPPVLPGAPVRDALRNLIFGGGAAGSY